jgi:hypothetical protein
MRKLFTIVAIAAALSFTTLSPSLAQTDDQGGPYGGMMGGGCSMMGMMGQGMMGRGRGMWGQGMMGNRQARMSAMVDGRLAYLKGELSITDAQKEAWEGYAEAVKGRVETMQGLRKAMLETMQKGGAIERMDARIAGMQAMVDAMSAVKPATEKLYGVLTAEQKKIADELIGLDCGAM